MTSPSHPGHGALEDDLHEALDALGATEEYLAAVAMDRIREAVSAWNVGQHLVHIGLAANSIATALHLLIRRGGGDEPVA